MQNFINKIINSVYNKNSTTFELKMGFTENNSKT